MIHKLSKERIAELIIDEEKAHDEYKSYGLNNIANDEKRHSLILKKMLRKAD